MHAELEELLYSRLGDYELLETREGEGNHNHIIESDGEKYVLRVSKEISEDRLENEHEMLRFLKSQGIENVPRPVFFDKLDKKQVLLETFVGEKDLEPEDFTESRLRHTAQFLAHLHSVPVEDYNTYTGETREEKTTLQEVYADDFEEWAEKRYEEYLELAEEPHERIKVHFERQKEQLEKVPDVPVELSVIHGDLGYNVRARRSEVFVVDWEFSRIGYPENDILYFLQHQWLEQEQQETFLEEYRKHRETQAFEDTSEFYPSFLAFNDMIWAAKRVAKGEEEKRELLEERMERLENMYRQK